ncbi:uncharacterized [Tachysurus ichikawai]
MQVHTERRESEVLLVQRVHQEFLVRWGLSVHRVHQDCLVKEVGADLPVLRVRQDPQALEAPVELRDPEGTQGE